MHPSFAGIHLPHKKLCVDISRTNVIFLWSENAVNFRRVSGQFKCNRSRCWPSLVVRGFGQERVTVWAPSLLASANIAGCLNGLNDHFWTACMHGEHANAKPSLQLHSHCLADMDAILILEHFLLVARTGVQFPLLNNPAQRLPVADFYHSVRCAEGSYGVRAGHANKTRSNVLSCRRCRTPRQSSHHQCEG